MKYSNIFDTHSHYDDSKFDKNRAQLLAEMHNMGVEHIVSCGCDIKTTIQNQELAKKYEFLSYACGFHPECLEGFSLDDVDKLKEFAKDDKCVAIGEIGLDYHWMSSPKQVQIDFFEKQIQLAKELNMPVIVHDREAHGDTMDILRQTKPKGVLHCFSGSKEMAKELVNLGMYIGFGGVVTFANARKSLEVAKEVPIERIVIETDCPYLAPVPHRGELNHSGHLNHVAEKIASLLEMDTQEFVNITTNNAKRLYNML